MLFHKSDPVKIQSNHFEVPQTNSLDRDPSVKLVPAPASPLCTKTLCALITRAQSLQQFKTQKDNGQQQRYSTVTAEKFLHSGGVAAGKCLKKEVWTCQWYCTVYFPKCSRFSRISYSTFKWHTLISGSMWDSDYQQSVVIVSATTVIMNTRSSLCCQV